MEERASTREVGGGKGVWRQRERAIARGRERMSALASSFCVFSPPGPALCKLGSARSAVYLKSSLRSSDLSLTFLCSIFHGFSLPCLLAMTILDSFSHSNYLTVWGWQAPGPGFRFPLKWWDSPPPSGNLEPANQHAPSKKRGTYQGKAEKPANAQV